MWVLELLEELHKLVPITTPLVNHNCTRCQEYPGHLQVNIMFEGHRAWLASIIDDADYGRDPKEVAKEVYEHNLAKVEELSAPKPTKMKDRNGSNAPSSD